MLLSLQKKTEKKHKKNKNISKNNRKKTIHSFQNEFKKKTQKKQ